MGLHGIVSLLPWATLPRVCHPKQNQFPEHLLDARKEKSKLWPHPRGTRVYPGDRPTSWTQWESRHSTLIKGHNAFFVCFEFIGVTLVHKNPQVSGV